MIYLKYKCQRGGIAVGYATVGDTLAAGYALLQQQINIFGTARINLEINEEEPSYSGWGTVTADRQTSWNGEGGKTVYQYEFKIENTSNSSINGWEIIMNVPEDATNHNSGTGNFEISNGRLKVTHTDASQTINPGGTLITYIQFATSDANYVLTYLSLNGIRMNLTGETVPLVGMKINQKNIKLSEGETNHLTVIFEPYNAGGNVTWTSSNPEVATVDESTGLVTGGKTGTTTITATCGEFSATCLVTIESPIVETNNIRVEFVKGSYWSNGIGYSIQYSLALENISGTAFTGWSFDIVLSVGSSYENGWNATVTNTSGTTYHIEGTQTLQPGVRSTDVGLTFTLPTPTYIPIPINVQP